MKTIVLFSLLALSAPLTMQAPTKPDKGAPAANNAARTGESRLLFFPEKVPWQEGPASLPPGATMAVLEGDPSKPGFFTMRLQLPDGYRVAPHSHPKQERLTIISGTLRLGMGDRFDEKALQALSPGTYSSMPAGMTHFAVAQGLTIIQLSSIGPWGVNYVNPADDPRRSSKR
jgi:quercetin dioxygenase-like cupin family protein